MKIVHVIGALVAGGAERFVTSLAALLRDTGADVSLWALSNRRDGVSEQLIGQLGAATVPWLSGPSHRLGWRTVQWFAGAVAQQQPHIIHLHTPNTEIVRWLSQPLRRRAATRSGGVLVRTIHNTALPSGWLERRAYRGNRASCSIACGAAVASAYATLISGELRIISNGVNFDGPVNSPEARVAARRQLGIAPDEFHVLHAGRMSGSSLPEAQKAQDVLIRAWRQSALGRRGAVLDLLGDGNLRAPLSGLAAEDPSIRFHGVRSDVPAWMQAADCFVMPSRHEGLSLVAIEAIGAGLPCIFSDIAALRELEPPAARWCAVDNVAELARLLSLSREQPMQPTAPATAAFRARYSLAHAADQYRQVYRQYA